MNRFIKKSRFQFGILSLLIAMLVAGVSVATHQRITKSPKLTQEEATQLADKFAASEFAGFNIKNYPDRTAEFDKTTKEWWVYYIYEPSRGPGDHFSITINDETKEMEFVGGM